ncbi:hypothetical protein Q8A67_024795 [Cirrhinus molitorella]|uniref:Rab11 family-interacting protein 3 n=1 Tax=Cirrhinus molitorella TaxID=172907 RepID=A0AA88P484_9TELE|nr:hypothetical protein Q8A67_024795 [Cirrhinus molitorella]
MEQVLSSPQGCSEWEVSGKAEWESEQDPLGFLLMDKDNTSVGDSTNDIFQESAINLDDLFWSSQYSGQTYSWENGLECVYPEWKSQPAPSHDLKGEGSLEIVDGDLISFNSRSTSPTFSNAQAQNQNTFYDLPKQVPDFLQPVEVTATSNALDVCTGELGITQTDKTLLQETHLLEDTHLTNCEFSHSSFEERTFVNNDSQSFHLSLESEGLLHVSPVELSCTDTNSNPKPSVICQFISEHIYLPSSALPCEPIPPTTHTEPTVPSYHEGTAHLPLDEVEVLLPGLLVGGLHSASNETHGDDFQTQETTDANMETTQLSSEVETVCQTPLGESYKSSKLCDETLCDLTTECTFDVPLETAGEEFEKEVMSSAIIDHVFAEAEIGLAPIAVVDLQAEDPSNESLLDKDEHKDSISEHNALFEFSPEDEFLPEDHNQPTPSTEADALFEVPHDGDVPDSTLEILTADLLPSLDSGGERSDYSMSTQNQVIPHCASNPDSLESAPFTCVGDQLTVTGGREGPDLTETTEASSQLCEAIEGEAGFPAQEDFHHLTPSQIDLAQEQQVSSVAPSSPPSHRNVFPCGASLDGEAYLTLMENNPDTPNIPKHAEMTLDLCKASDVLPTKTLHDQRVPVDLINVPLAHKSEEQSALRAVFQALDQDGDGFVHIEEFVEFAKAYGAEQVKDLTRFLDPSGLGVISFEDFHRGISAISNEGSDPDLYKTHLSAVEANGPQEEYDEQAEVSDSAYLGSESAYSECETFTDEDTTALVHPELHEDVETDSGIENTLTDGDDRNRFTLGSDLNGHTLVAVIGGEEEHFEDFGESNNTSDLLLANQDDEGAGPDGEGDTEPLPLPDSPLPRPLMLLSPSSSKRLSSKKAARHLQQSGTLDVMGDLTQDILDLADRDITDKVLLLEKRVCELEKDSSESEEQHARLRQENLALVHRANALEEQLKEQELHAEENLVAHTRKHRETLNKLQRERDLEIENLQARLHQLDEENSELRSCVPCLRANIERLEEEKRKLQDEVDDVSDRLNEEIESRRKMSDKLSHERHTNQKEKECTQGLIEDLRKQLEHLQLFKLETEARRGRSASSGLQEYNTHMRENELEQEIRRLKQDNRSLKEQNDELNGQIINLSIQGAKSLFTESLSESLAAEINNVSRAELMEAIHKQEEINFRLQDYIDRIIVAIMESNPSILEVK